MATFQVSLGRKFTNNFTRKGRMQNKFYKSMERKGLKHLVQRDLKDGSSVILAYQNKNEKYANYATKINADLSSETKRETVYHMAIPGVKGTHFSRIFEDRKGKCTRYSDMTSIRKNGENIRKETLDEFEQQNMRRSEVFLRDGRAKSHFSLIDLEDAVRVVEKEDRNRNHIYTYAEHKDGSKTFYRNINGDEYLFTTKK